MNQPIFDFPQTVKGVDMYGVLPEVADGILEPDLLDKVSACQLRLTAVSRDKNSQRSGDAD